MYRLRFVHGLEAVTSRFLVVIDSPPTFLVAGGSIQLSYPVGTQEGRYCAADDWFGAGPGSPQLVCGTRDLWTGFGAFYGYQTVGTGMPTTYGQATNNIPGLQTTSDVSAWGWYIENTTAFPGTRLWMLVSTPTAVLRAYTRPNATAQWTGAYAQLAIDGQASYNLHGRMEGGHAILYIAGGPRILAFNCTTTAYRVVISAPPNTHFRAVAFAPLAEVAASPSNTRTGTPSPSSTASPSGTATVSKTPSQTGSPSNSQGATPSGTMTRSNTPSITPSSTPTNIPARFSAGNMIVLRTDNSSGAIPTTGRYAPVFLDELDPVTGYVVSSLAMPTTQELDGTGGVKNFRCTLPVSVLRLMVARISEATYEYVFFLFTDVVF